MTIPSAADLMRLPAGDREPRIRYLIERERTELVAIEGEAGDPITSQRRTLRTRNIAKLRHVATTIGFELKP
ncbi:hypothetical protein [Methylobacterium sp. E-045]|uniref:hypothetical protein n=1 Tax=Methylobacterium sp. E-045 TaxID=2836575 RepID=UPI001FB90199|nr:hypothetical protein [Methylobacterium sp. E-045]MCJ2128675.1 hypothetical protein [Methylobacterium sp. E-045]